MSIVSFLIGIALLVIVLKILSMPFKIIWKLIVNSILGFIVIYAFRFFGIPFDVQTYTYVLIGLFGIPGILISLVISLIL